MARRTVRSSWRTRSRRLASVPRGGTHAIVPALGQVIVPVLGIPVGTAGSRIHHASRALRAALDADDRTDSPKERTA